jgi:hypothetical protein
MSLARQSHSEMERHGNIWIIILILINHQRNKKNCPTQKLSRATKKKKKKKKKSVDCQWLLAVFLFSSQMALDWLSRTPMWRQFIWTRQLVRLSNASEYLGMEVGIYPFSDNDLGVTRSQKISVLVLWPKFFVHRCTCSSVCSIYYYCNYVDCSTFIF